MLPKGTATTEIHTHTHTHTHTNTTFQLRNQVILFWKTSSDFLGPLPKSSGNKHILFIGDQFTKSYEAIAMRNQGASTVADAF